MKIQYYILGLIFGLFTLTNCSWSQEKINLSIVKIFNKSGHGTGFFVKGKPGLCSVLTVAHVLKEKEKNYIETKDSKRWPIKEIKIRSSGIDLALLTFKPEGDKCNYLPLKIGNSESLKIYNPIYISGYPNRGLNGRPIMQSVEGKVSGVGSLAKGYGISYRAFTVGGMSGAPVLDKTGKVVAIHGMSDFEIVQRWESKQANLSEGQRALYDGAVKRINTDQRLTFSWGIPIFWFQESNLYYSNNSNWNLAWLWYCVLLIIGGCLIYSRIQYFQVSQVLRSVNKSPKLSRQEVEKKLKTVQKIQQQSPEELEKGKLFYFEVVKVNQSGEITSRNKESARQKIEDLGDGIELEMVKIPGGRFLMGSLDTEAKRYSDEGPQHYVDVPEFFMGKYVVTQGQWKAIASRTDLKVQLDLKTEPSYFKGPDKDIDRWNRPVEQVNWFEAVEFCKRLSKLTGRNYRLPSEAEWEYACRAGTTTPFYFGETITTGLVNYCGSYTYGNAPKGEYREQTTPVGQFPANAFGLYDMHGNVWEWCADECHKNYADAPTDGSIWLNGDKDKSLLRGGSWADYPDLCRSAIRFFYLRRDDHNYFTGFRVVCDGGRTL